jgi:L-alanine-DL-glutamate epimerase-like enolase superfamily enzyme
MRDRPDGATLRRLALDALRQGDEEPALIARALAIAEREAAAGAAPLEALRARLILRYGEGSDNALLARLAAEIRAGAFDTPGTARAAIRQLLWDLTAQKLAESNPEYLAAATEGWS